MLFTKGKLFNSNIGNNPTDYIYNARQGGSKVSYFWTLTRKMKIPFIRNEPKDEAEVLIGKTLSVTNMSQILKRCKFV